MITGIVRLDEPPLRLPLGSDPIRLADEAAEARAAEAEKPADTIRSADFPADT
jgi:hypothetical protein